MTPRFVFWECKNCDDSFKNQNCFGDGAYCGNSKKTLTGQQVMLEDLRMICVYKKAYEDLDNRVVFWDYMERVHDECGSQLNEDCSKYAHKVIDELNWEETDKCVKDSFSTQNQAEWVDEGVTNILIDQDIEYWNKYGSVLNPSIVINNSTYRGQLEPQAVMNALCAGFSAPPGMCQKLLSDEDIENDLETGIVYYNDGYQHHHMVGVGLIACIVTFIFLCFYRRSAKR